MDGKTFKNQSWKQLPWKLFYTEVFDLQCKIYSVMRTGEYETILELQELLIENSSTHHIATKYIIDSGFEKTVFSLEETFLLESLDRIEFVTGLHKYINNWTSSSRIKLTYKHNKVGLEFNFIEDLKEKIVQYILKLALEPVYEAIASSNSYGERAGRQPCDIQRELLVKLQKMKPGKKHKLLKIDLTEFTESICDKKLLEKIILPTKYKLGIAKILKSGILKKSTLGRNHNLLAALILNIALHGIEDLHLNRNTKLLHSFRHLQVMVYIVDVPHSSEKAVKQISRFFDTIGLSFSPRCITLVDDTDGFDFVNWHFRRKSNIQVISCPSKKDWIFYKKCIKSTLKNPTCKIEARLKKLENISKSWYKAHIFSDMSPFSSQIFLLKKWCSNYIRKNTNISRTDRLRTVKSCFKGRHTKTTHFKVVNEKSLFDGD